MRLYDYPVNYTNKSYPKNFFIKLCELTKLIVGVDYKIKQEQVCL